MEESVFPAPAVAGRLKKMIEARVHNDGDNQDEIRDWQGELLKTFATPSYGLMDPATGALITKHVGPEANPELFAEWLDEAYAAWEAR
jgi:hypothetical protein